MAVAGVNDILSIDPSVARFLHEDQPDVDLATLRPSSTKRLVWKCPLGHTWTSTLRAFNALGGHRCPYCNGRKVWPGFNDLATTHPSLAEEIDIDERQNLSATLTAGSGRRITWRCPKGHQWVARVVDRIHHGTGCPECAAAAWTSAGEDDLAAWFESALGLVVERQVFLRDGASRAVYDITLPEQRLMVEFNGVYFHSEAVGRTRDYHAAKRRLAEASGYSLVTVWEDDWRDRREIVEQMLAYRVGRSLRPKVDARATTVERVTGADAREFLTQHHIQGSVGGSIILGLRDREIGLVAVMVMKVSGRSAFLARYATSATVRGGFTRLLAAVDRSLAAEHPGVDRVVTYSDNMVSNGSLYAQSGFVRDEELPPDYTYLRPGRARREHKFNYRIARFKADPDLDYVDGSTERELAALNGLHRVWDAGKVRWVRPVARPCD